MATLNQSLDMNLNLDQTRKATWPRTAVTIAAWIEILVGASFLLVLNAQSQLIFSAATEGSGVHFAQLAGIALISLGIPCLPSNPVATRSLLIYNIAATILFAWVALATTFHGVVLWPVVILHAVLSIVLALALRRDV